MRCTAIVLVLALWLPVSASAQDPCPRTTLDESINARVAELEEQAEKTDVWPYVFGGLALVAGVVLTTIALVITATKPDVVVERAP